MHQSLQLLDKAIDMALNEQALLELEDVEGLEESAAERFDLLQRAMEGRQGCDEGAMLARLEELGALQAKLTRRGRVRLEETRAQLKNRNKAAKVITGYYNGLGRPVLKPRWSKTS